MQLAADCGTRGIIRHQENATGTTIGEIAADIGTDRMSAPVMLAANTANGVAAAAKSQQVRKHDLEEHQEPAGCE